MSSIGEAQSSVCEVLLPGLDGRRVAYIVYSCLALYHLLLPPSIQRKLEWLSWFC